MRMDGHMGIANTLAMKSAGITPSTKEISGGEMVKNSKGNFTGIFKDNAMGMITKTIAAPRQTVSKNKAVDAG